MSLHSLDFNLLFVFEKRSACYDVNKLFKVGDIAQSFPSSFQKGDNFCDPLSVSLDH